MRWAQNVVTGGNLKPILQRIAHAQRAQLRLHDKITAQQAGAKLVGRVYAAAPLAFLVFLRVIGGESYAAFYRTLYGTLAQVAIALSGLIAWWLTNRIAGRRLCIDDQATAPRLNEQVHQTRFRNRPYLFLEAYTIMQLLDLNNLFGIQVTISPFVLACALVAAAGALLVVNGLGSLHGWRIRSGQSVDLELENDRINGVTRSPAPLSSGCWPRSHTR